MNVKALLSKKPLRKSVKQRQRMTQAERTALSDKRMFETALLLVREHGTPNTTLKEIGERAGYSRGLASSRFGSKEQFFYELVGEMHDRWQDEFKANRGRRRGLDAIKKNFESTKNFLTRDPDYLRSMYLLYYETIGSNALIRERLADYHGRHIKALCRWLTEGIKDGDVDPETDIAGLATEYLAFYYGLIYLWLTDSDSIDFERTLSAYFAGFLKRVFIDQK